MQESLPLNAEILDTAQTDGFTKVVLLAYFSQRTMKLRQTGEEIGWTIVPGPIRLIEQAHVIIEHPKGVAQTRCPDRHGVPVEGSHTSKAL